MSTKNPGISTHASGFDHSYIVWGQGHDLYDHCGHGRIDRCRLVDAGLGRSGDVGHDVTAPDGYQFVVMPAAGFDQPTMMSVEMTWNI